METAAQKSSGKTNRYVIELRGFECPYYVDAISPAQAKYKCWSEGRDVGYFLKTSLASFASLYVTSVRKERPCTQSKP